MPYAIGTVPSYPGVALEKPVEFSEDVTFGPIKPWVQSEDLAKDLDINHRNEFLHETQWAFTWTIPEGASTADSDRVFKAANLAVWLARPTDFRVKVIAVFATAGDPESRSRTSWGDFLYPHSSYQGSELTLEDFALAARLFPKLLDKDGTLVTAAWALWKALCERDFAVRYALCWIALEGLYGPDDGREITFRLSQRVAFFLGSTAEEQKDLFSRMKKAYTWRSKVVHGLKLQKLTTEESRRLLLDVEQTAQQSLAKVLLDPGFIATFDSKAREPFLDELSFGPSATP